METRQRVIADPVFYELLVPEFAIHGQRARRIRIDLKEFGSAGDVAFIIREATDGVVLVDSYAKAWAKLWAGDYVVGRGDNRTHVLGLKAKLLARAATRTGKVTDFRSNTVFRLFMSIIDKAQLQDEDDQPDENGRPRWRSDRCCWFQFDHVITQMKRIDKTISRKDVDRVLELLERKGELGTGRFKFGLKEPKYLLIRHEDMKSLHDASEYGLEDRPSRESEAARV